MVELRKLLIKHVLGDATDDHVQELAAMEAAPTAGDTLERVISEDNMGAMGEGAMKDVQKHAKRLQDLFQGTSDTRGSS